MKTAKLCLLIPLTLVATNETWETFKDPGKAWREIGEGRQAIEDGTHKNETIKGLIKIIQDQNAGNQKIAENLDKNTKAVEKVAEAQTKTNVILMGATGALALYGTYKAGEEIYNSIQEYRNPSPEKIDQKEAALAKIETRRSKQKFDRCLVQNRNVRRDANGVPNTCDEAYHSYAAAVGYEKSKSAVQAFEKNNPL